MNESTHIWSPFLLLFLLLSPNGKKSITSSRRTNFERSLVKHFPFFRLLQQLAWMAYIHLSWWQVWLGLPFDWRFLVGPISRAWQLKPGCQIEQKNANPSIHPTSEYILTTTKSTTTCLLDYWYSPSLVFATSLWIDGGKEEEKPSSLYAKEPLLMRFGCEGEGNRSLCHAYLTHTHICAWISVRSTHTQKGEEESQSCHITCQGIWVESAGRQRRIQNHVKWHRALTCLVKSPVWCRHRDRCKGRLYQYDRALMWGSTWTHRPPVSSGTI